MAEGVTPEHGAPTEEMESGSLMDATCPRPQPPDPTPIPWRGPQGHKRTHPGLQWELRAEGGSMGAAHGDRPNTVYCSTAFKGQTEDAKEYSSPPVDHQPSGETVPSRRSPSSLPMRQSMVSGATARRV